MKQDVKREVELRVGLGLIEEGLGSFGEALDSLRTAESLEQVRALKGRFLDAHRIISRGHRVADEAVGPLTGTGESEPGRREQMTQDAVLRVLCERYPEGQGAGQQVITKLAHVGVAKLQTWISDWKERGLIEKEGRGVRPTGKARNMFSLQADEHAAGLNGSSV